MEGNGKRVSPDRVQVQYPCGFSGSIRGLSQLIRLEKLCLVLIGHNSRPGFFFRKRPAHKCIACFLVGICRQRLRRFALHGKRLHGTGKESGIRLGIIVEYHRIRCVPLRIQRHISVGSRSNIRHSGCQIFILIPAAEGITLFFRHRKHGLRHAVIIFHAGRIPASAVIYKINRISRGLPLGIQSNRTAVFLWQEVLL